MMKKLLLLLYSIILYTNIYSQQLYTDWKWIHQTPHGQDLRWVQIFDEDLWYAAGMDGIFMRTTDGGQSWMFHSKASHPYGDGAHNMIYIGHFFDRNTGIVGGGDAIRRTTDGGTTWGRINYSFSTSGIIWGSHFRGNVGYVSGDDSIMIHRTSNAGLNWTKMFVPNLPYHEIFWDVWSPTNDIIVAGGKHGKIYRTSDAGTTWNVIDLGYDENVYAVNFKDNTTGFAVGGGGTASYTTDAGATWTNVSSGLPDFAMRDVDFPTINGVEHVVVTGSPWYLYATTNMGSSWFTIAHRPSMSSQRWNDLYHSTDFLSDGSFVTVGESGQVNSKMGSGSPKYHGKWLKAGNLMDVWGDKPFGSIIAVGEETNSSQNDHIIRSTNGGQDWIIENVSTNETLRKISMVNSNVGYIVGTGGVAFKTTNGGASWSSLTTNVTNNLYGVDFVSEDVGWAVGSGGTVLKTINGGETWTRQNPSIPASIYGVDFFDENTGWVTAASGIVKKTTDGGTTWIQQDAKADSATLYGVKAVNDMVVYAVGSLSTISKTTDGGATWDSIAPPPHTGTINIYDVDFKDENFGVLVGTSSKVITTTNGGASWTLEFANNTTAFGVDIVDSTQYGYSIYVVGLNSSIFANNAYVTPVELSSFTASVQENNITLNWKTATEENNSGFSIEKSFNEGPFSQIGFVGGKGTTTEINDYSFEDNNLANGKYIYRLKQIDFDGTASFSNEVEVNVSSLPFAFSLEQNFPNPFNPSTIIKYSLPVQEQVVIKIFDVLGTEVTTLVNEVKPAGRYEIVFNADNLASGLYLYQIKSGSFTDMKKMMLMK